MKYLLLIVLALVFTSCFLVRDYSKGTFSYQENGVAKQVPIIIPKGFKRTERRTNEEGIQEQVYHYGNDVRMFFAYMPRGGNYLAIDTHYHIPQPQLRGGIFYKGTGIGEYWWREAQVNGIRVGYNKVPIDKEPVFDSAVNFVRIR